MSARAVRLLMAAAGGACVFLTFAAGAVGMQTVQSVGPLQLQVGVFGLLLMVSAIPQSPSRVVARMIDGAREHAIPLELVPPTRRSVAALAAIVVLAFGFRSWLAVSYVPPDQMAMGMTLWDADMARNLLAGRGFVINEDFVGRVNAGVVRRKARVDPEDFLPADDAAPGALKPLVQFAPTPGYSVWLAASFYLGGGLRFIYSEIMQAALDASGCLLVFGIARRLWSNAAGLVGALFYAVSPAHAHVAVQAVAAATDGFWVLLTGYGIVRMWHDLRREQPLWRGAACVATAAFCGAAMNSFGLVMPAIALAWTACVGLFVRPVWRLMMPLTAALVVAVALLLPWGFRNQKVYGDFTIVRQTFWQFAWETLGALPNPWGLAIGNNDAAYWSWVSANCAAPCSPKAREAVTRDYMIHHVFMSAAFPGHLVRMVARQVPGLLYVSRLPVDVPYAHPGFAGRLTKVGIGIADAAMLLMWPLALCGLVMVTRRGADAAGAWLGLAPSLFIIAFSLVFLVEHRRTTAAYGYLLALSAIPVAALAGQHAHDY